MKPIVVLYHADCSDGFGAAWAAWRKFKNKAEYIPVEPQRLPMKPLIGKIIYVLDNCYPAAVLEKLKQNNKSITVIDHHFSNAQEIEHATNYLFDNNHSGAVLSWRYFHPHQKTPLILKYVEDQDLWRFKIKNTKEIMAVLANLTEATFLLWNKIAKVLETYLNRQKYVEKGELILQTEEILMEEIIANAQLVNFQGHKTLAVNSPILESEIAHKLYKKLPPLAIVWKEKKDRRTFSLRSNGKVDVAKMAARFGGGGHKAAAGFAMKLTDKLPWKVIKN